MPSAKTTGTEVILVRNEGPITFAEAVSGSDAAYTHQQDAALATWNVVHNLGKYPSVTVVNLQNVIVIGDVTYTNANSLVVSFSAPFSGKAYLN